MQKKLEKTLRIPFREDIRDYLISRNFKKEKLPKLIDEYFKPINTSITELHAT